MSSWQCSIAGQGWSVRGGQSVSPQVSLQHLGSMIPLCAELLHAPLTVVVGLQGSRPGPMVLEQLCHHTAPN